MLDRPQFDLTTHALAGVLEDLHGVEFESVVEYGVEDEHAPGPHVGDGLERLDGEASGHAADEFVAGGGPDRIASGVGFFNGQRELEPPFEHHLENDIKFGAVGFHHIEHKLTGLQALDARVVKREDAEADVEELPRFLTQLELAVGFIEFSLNLVARAADTLLANITKIIFIFCSYRKLSILR